MSSSTPQSAGTGGSGGSKRSGVPLKKKSPFSNSKRYKKSPDDKNKPTYRIIIVKPDQDSVQDGGFLVRIDGRAENRACSALYDRKSNHYDAFIEDVDPVKRVMTFRDEDGMTMTNGNGYPCKGLCFIQDKEELTEENVKDFVEECYIPAAIAYDKAMAEKPLSDDLWKLTIDTTEPITIVKHWGDILGDEDIWWVLKDKIAPANGFDSPQQYVKASQEHLYATWKEGGVPVHVMNKYRLVKMHMHEDDWARYQRKMGATRAVNSKNTTTVDAPPDSKDENQVNKDLNAEDPENKGGDSSDNNSNK